MPCKAVPLLLVLLISTLFLPWAAAAAGNGRTYPIGHLGENIQPEVRVSDGDGRMSAVPYVTVTVPPAQGDEAGRAGIPCLVEGAVSKAEKGVDRGKMAASAVKKEKEIGAKIGAMVSGEEEISCRKVAGIIRDIRKAVKKSREMDAAKE